MMLINMKKKAKIKATTAATRAKAKPKIFLPKTTPSLTNAVTRAVVIKTKQMVANTLISFLIWFSFNISLMF